MKAVTQGYFTAIGYGANLAAGVHLPIGASITGLEITLNDQNDPIYEEFNYIRINLVTGVAETIATLYSPPGTTEGVQQLVIISIARPLVSENYAYQLVTSAMFDVLVYGARISYGYNVNLPLVNNE